MIHVIQGMRNAAHAQLLESMFLDRKRLFVDLLGWDVPVIDGCYEIDRFDGGPACYLVAADAAGKHMGSMRLLPSLRPHILDTLFPDLCEGPIPRGSSTFEITRLCLPQRLGAGGRLEVRNALISAMVDHALSHGINAFTGVVETTFLEQIMVMGWSCRALGPSQAIGRRPLSAFAISIDDDTPRLLSRTGIYAASNPIVTERTRAASAAA